MVTETEIRYCYGYNLTNTKLYPSFGEKLCSYQTTFQPLAISSSYSLWYPATRPPFTLYSPLCTDLQCQHQYGGSSVSTIRGSGVYRGASMCEPPCQR